MRAAGPIVAILLLVSPAASSASDGQLAWTQLSFCNGAGYCVQIDTDSTNRVKSIAISHDGKPIDPPDLKYLDGEPDLQHVRLVNASATNGFENRLEIPFFGKNGYMVTITIVDDKVTVIKQTVVGDEDV
jgi:hypothetical protein